MVLPAERKWRVECPELHKFVGGELHDFLSVENIRREISELPDKAVARRREWRDYQEDRLERRREHFEQKVAVDESLRDPSQDLHDTHCFSSLRLEINAEQEVDILAGPLAGYYTQGQDFIVIGDPSNHPAVGVVYIEGWVPWELEQDDDSKQFRLVPPLDDPLEGFRKFTRLEILTSLVLVHDAHHEYEVLVPHGHIFSNLNGPFGFRLHFIHKSAEDGWVSPLRAWLDSLDPETNSDYQPVHQNPVTRAAMIEIMAEVGEVVVKKIHEAGRAETQSSDPGDSQIDELHASQDGDAAEPDGPCHPYTWRHNGVTLADNLLQRATWNLVNYLWNAINYTALFDDLGEPVYGDREEFPGDTQVGKQRTLANKVFATHGIPWKVATSPRDHRVWLKHTDS